MHFAILAKAPLSIKRGLSSRMTMKNSQAHFGLFWGKVQEKLQRRRKKVWREITNSYDCEARSGEELKALIQVPETFMDELHLWTLSKMDKQLLSTTGAFIDRVHPRMPLVLESMLWLRSAGPHFTREECTWDLGSSGIFFDSSPVHSSKMKFAENSTVLESQESRPK